MDDVIAKIVLGNLCERVRAFILFKSAVVKWYDDEMLYVYSPLP
jgi:hypothetical protein